MSFKLTKGAIAVNIEMIARIVNFLLPVVTLGLSYLAYHCQGAYLYFAIGFGLLTLLNFYYRHIQKKHTLLANFGLVAQLRYMIESIGPEFRQYLYMSDTEGRPFNREQRSEIYTMSKGLDSTSSFGSKETFEASDMKLRHSMFPQKKEDIEKYSLSFGEERGIKNIFTIDKPIIISAMSYGSLGKRAVQALSHGAAKAGIAMNTGEGGYPKYHLMGGADLIFQMGTAKFGTRNDDSSLNEDKLRKLSQEENVKMIEIKFSQGAKPGKGGLLPKEKIDKEISELRGVPMGKDVLSPSHHIECHDPESTVKFIKRVQDISELPVGIKMCLGSENEFIRLIEEMKAQDIFPDYISIDGAEGGTGAAPRSFMDDVGIPLFKALPFVHKTLIESGVRDKMKLLAAGKLIDAGRQMMALSMGADAIYSARGFMLAIGCIQALQCNQNSCPVGITTHNPKLENGLDIDEKSVRVKNYVDSLIHDQEELLVSIGKKSLRDLNFDNLYLDGKY